MFEAFVFLLHIFESNLSGNESDSIILAGIGSNHANAAKRAATHILAGMGFGMFCSSQSIFFPQSQPKLMQQYRFYAHGFGPTRSPSPFSWGPAQMNTSCRDVIGRNGLHRSLSFRTDVEETVKMLIKMSISTPELRATVERTGTLTDAAHWSRAILVATFIAFTGQTPVVLIHDGHFLLGVPYGWLHWLLTILSIIEALVFVGLFILLPPDRKAFAARVQSFWLLLWPVKVFGFCGQGGEGHPAYYLVSVCILPPLLLALSILGPAQTARIPFVGPRLVRLVFGKPRCLKRLGCCAGRKRMGQDNKKSPLPMYGFSERWRF